MPLIVAHILAINTLDILLKGRMSQFVQTDVLLACVNSNGIFVLRPYGLAGVVEESGRRDDGFENGVEASVGERALAEVEVC
jgi:hypothetical protein